MLTAKPQVILSNLANVISSTSRYMVPDSIRRRPLKKLAMGIMRTAAWPLIAFYGKKSGLDPAWYASPSRLLELIQCIFFQKILRINSHVPWPVHFSSSVPNPHNIFFDRRYVRNFMSAGCYWQGISPITFQGSFLVAQGVSFVSQNHDVYDMGRHATPSQDMVIGDNCLFSLNAVILPGVQLGENTIVAAGAVVHASFPEGNCVLAGVPARIVKRLDPQRVRKCDWRDFWG
jgi:acetyltransferase-like isoleucine patch superfamily enzyme